MWGAIKSAVSAIAGIVDISKWFTRKKDRADAMEAGADKQKAKNADVTLNSMADAKKADARMRPGSPRAKRMRSRYQRD